MCNTRGLSPGELRYMRLLGDITKHFDVSKGRYLFYNRQLRFSNLDAMPLHSAFPSLWKGVVASVLRWTEGLRWLNDPTLSATNLVSLWRVQNKRELAVSLEDAVLVLTESPKGLIMTMFVSRVNMLRGLPELIMMGALLTRMVATVDDCPSAELLVIAAELQLEPEQVAGVPPLVSAKARPRARLMVLPRALRLLDYEESDFVIKYE